MYSSTPPSPDLESVQIKIYCPAGIEPRTYWPRGYHLSQRGETNCKCLGSIPGFSIRCMVSILNTWSKLNCCCSSLVFTILFNISGHQRRFLHWAWKSDKFCSEALILAWGSFTCRKSTTREQRLYFPSERSHTQDVYALKKFIDPCRVWTREPRIQWRVW